MQMQESKIPAPPGAAMPEVPVAVEPVAEAPKPKVAVKKKISVIALRDGWYMNERRLPGAKFQIDGPHQLGSWMECVDPLEQKAHLAALKAKKQAVNAQSVADHKAELAADV